MQRKAAKLTAYQDNRNKTHRARPAGLRPSLRQRQPQRRRLAHPMAAVLGCTLLLLGACGPSDSTFPDTPSDGQGRTDPNPNPNEARESIFGEGGLTLFGGDSKPSEGGVGIGVNSFLWRASLDTIAFMPLSSADPFGGVIITDWYSDPRTPDERFKMTVYILDRRLRADGVKVAVFRQQRDPEQGWTDAAPNPDTGLQLENAILTRARELRIATIEPGQE